MFVSWSIRKIKNKVNMKNEIFLEKFLLFVVWGKVVNYWVIYGFISKVIRYVCIFGFISVYNEIWREVVELRYILILRWVLKFFF